ncbi:hypothetical protein SAMN04487944_11223 [Gracilibacillus ureilyticus]|uniref:YwdI family protein n=1 Tax=Gracilibacillus ureilyticus TaxID=531814 RepID=A0A1H9SVM1_9BACI|nr:DUF5327 family protein [Gracilibacillus ureilyticus]SER88955.1 hypothetical protein SAMN04487944_11223 [Gracilibacillus ureilyticus]
MAITDKQILKKIIHECEQALQNGKTREHAKAVQTLADLLLDSEEQHSSINSVEQITEKEWRQMVGEKPVRKTEKVELDEDNGGSLLDF